MMKSVVGIEFDQRLNKVNPLVFICW